MNGYQYAALAPGESLQSPEACDCCGREGLKKTIKLVNPEGRAVWFGVGCAARALSEPERLVRKARDEQIETADKAQRDAAKAAHDAEQGRFSAWLLATVGAFADWDGRPNRAKQLEALGGYRAAFNAYREAQS